MVMVSMRPQFFGSCGGATGPASVRIGSVRPKLAEERALALGARLQRQHAGADVGGVQEDLAHGERPALRMQVLDGVGADDERLAHVVDACRGRRVPASSAMAMVSVLKIEPSSKVPPARRSASAGSSQSAGREGSTSGSETAARISPELASSTSPAAPAAA